MTNLHRINLNLLVTLDCLLLEKSVGRCAEKLCLSQPAVSMQLQQLRQLFSNELLIREKNKFVLTEFAKDLQPKLQRTLKELTNLVDFGECFDAMHCDRTFKIGMSDQWASTLLPKLVFLLKKEAPHIKINIFPLIHVHDDQPFTEHHCDMTFARTAETLPKNIVKELVLNEAIVCVLGKKNPFAKKEKFTLSDYLSCKHIAWRTENAAFPSAVDVYLESIGRKARNSVLHIPYIDTVYRLIEESREYVSTVSIAAAKLVEGKHKCVIRPFPIKKVDINNKFYLAWHSQFDLDLAHEWLRNKLISLVQNS